MARVAVRKLVSFQALSLLVLASLILVGLLTMARAYGDLLPVRSLELSTAIPAANDTYTFGFKIPKNETLGSIEMEICSEGPLAGTPCTTPVGFDMSGATLATQTGITDFTVQSVTSNTIVLTHTAALAPANTALTFEFNNIINPTSAGSYYGRIHTFTTTDASGSDTDFGGLAFAVNESLQVATYVPPYLYFCVGLTISGTDCTTASGDYINFGDFTTSTASAADSQMVAGTNADTGYNIIVSGTTLTSGNNIIPALATADVSRPGTSQFGINLVANNDPPIGQDPGGSGSGSPATGYNQANIYKFVPGDTIASVSLPDLPRSYTVSYIANIAKAQAPGIYASTMTYIATAGF